MDLFLPWNGDLVLTPNGSVQFAVNWDQVSQRIIRRLITNPQRVLPNGRTTAPDYLFDTGYGFGVGALEGNDLTVGFLQDLQRRIVAACTADAAVDSGVPVSVTFTQPQPDALVVQISVTLVNGAPGTVALTFPA